MDPRLAALLDKDAVVDCNARYARGLDRLDLDLYRSAFHDDALDCRGGQPKTPEEFLEAFLPVQPTRKVTQHLLTTQSIELDGDTAHGETYYVAAVQHEGDADVALHGGRYVDRFERRDGVWRMSVKVVIPEWHVLAPAAVGSAVLARARFGSRSADDPSYERPLQPRESALAPG